MRIEFTVSPKADYKRIFNAVRNMVLKSGLAFEPAKVNKNWPRLAYGPVLGYAQESLGEFADIYLVEPVDAKQVREALIRAAGPWIQIKRVERVPYALPSVANLAEVVRYYIEGDFSAWHRSESLSEFLKSKQPVAVVTAPSGMTQEIALKPYVLDCTALAENKISLTLQTVNGKSVKPEYIVAAWLELDILQGEEFTVDGCKFIREGLYWRDSQGGLHRI